MFWVLVDVCGILGPVAVLALAVWLEPDPRGYGTHTQLGLEPCGYLQSTGLRCVTCGLTTSFAAMAEADPVHALRANPMGVPLFLVTLAMPLWFGHALWTGRDPFRFLVGRRGRWILPALVVGLALCWIARVAP